MRRTGIVAVCALAGAALYLLWSVLSSERVNRVEPLPPATQQQVDATEGARGAEPLRAAPLVEQSPEPGRTESPSSANDSIEGVALLPDKPCTSGFVFAWEDGSLPTGGQFRARANRAKGSAHASVHATPILSNGSFRLVGLTPGRSYTLSAVTSGAVCVERRSGLHLGAADVELHLLFTYGVAIRLEDARGGAVRTTDKLFGGPRISGRDPRVHDGNDGLPELDALAIAGLEPRGWTPARWQYLAVSASETASIGPFDYSVEVPGYLPKKETLQVPRLIAKLAEATVKLEPKATSWEKVSVRIVGVPRMESLGLDEERIVGSVYLIEDPKKPFTFGVHPRALVETEVVTGVPAGSYQVYFEASDAHYQTKETKIAIGPGPSVLSFDCSDSGSLLFELQDQQTTPPDVPFLAQLQDKDGGSLSIICHARPYLIPLLYPGTYKITNLMVNEHVCPHAEDVQVFQGRTTSVRVVR